MLKDVISHSYDANTKTSQIIIIDDDFISMAELNCPDMELAEPFAIIKTYRSKKINPSKQLLRYYCNMAYTNRRFYGNSIEYAMNKVAKYDCCFFMESNYIYNINFEKLIIPIRYFCQTEEDEKFVISEAKAYKAGKVPKRYLNKMIPSLIDNRKIFNVLK
jgi:hypothetical protein